MSTLTGLPRRARNDECTKIVITKSAFTRRGDPVKQAIIKLSKKILVIRTGPYGQAIGKLSWWRQTIEKLRLTSQFSSVLTGGSITTVQF